MSMHALAVEAVRNELARRTQRDEVLAISSSVKEHHQELLRDEHGTPVTG